MIEAVLALAQAVSVPLAFVVPPVKWGGGSFSVAYSPLSELLC